MARLLSRGRVVDEAVTVNGDCGFWAGSVSVRLVGLRSQVKLAGHVSVSPVVPVQKPRLDSVMMKFPVPPCSLVWVVVFASIVKPYVTTTSRYVTRVIEALEPVARTV